MVKSVILAGGRGTRLSEETVQKPKPMVEIGGKPILWHIMKIYAAHGVTDFIVCLGYRGYLIKEYFQNFFLHNSDVTFDLGKNEMHVHRAHAEPWKVTLIETGDDTMTGGRIKRILPYVADDPYFCITYGDGVGDIDITSVIKAHEAGRRLATVTAAQPPGRFGSLNIQGELVADVREKPVGDGGWINCGFFVLSPRVGEYITNDTTVWEKEPMERLAEERQLGVVFHRGFWQPMDTLRDKLHLEELWERGEAKWKIWN